MILHYQDSLQLLIYAEILKHDIFLLPPLGLFDVFISHDFWFICNSIWGDLLKMWHPVGLREAPYSCKRFHFQKTTTIITSELIRRVITKRPPTNSQNFILDTCGNLAKFLKLILLMTFQSTSLDGFECQDRDYEIFK